METSCLHFLCRSELSELFIRDAGEAPFLGFGNQLNPILAGDAITLLHGACVDVTDPDVTPEICGRRPKSDDLSECGVAGFHDTQQYRLYYISQYKKYRAFSVHEFRCSDPMTTETNKRLIKAREDAGFETAEAFAAKHNINAATYRSHENGHRTLTKRAAKEYAPLLKVSYLWLMGEDVVDQGNGFVYIPKYDVVASAGSGRLVVQEHVLYKIGFKNEWLWSLTHAPADQLGMLDIDGDSMEPTLEHGDVALFDRTQISPTKQGIYVIRIEDEICVKRLHYDPGKRSLTLISDNKTYPPIEIKDLDTIAIIGRVLWSAGRV